jgi:hypothetical protein
MTTYKGLGISIKYGDHSRKMELRVKQHALGVRVPQGDNLRPGLLRKLPSNRLAISTGTDAPVLACEVIDYAKRIFDIAARKIRLVLDNFTALLYESLLRVGNVVNRHFQDWPQGRARFDEQVDVLAMEADHLRVVVGNFESEMVDIKKGSFLRIWGLN